MLPKLVKKVCSYYSRGKKGFNSKDFKKNWLKNQYRKKKAIREQGLKSPQASLDQAQDHPLPEIQA
jgi:hypothetical protein